MPMIRTRAWALGMFDGALGPLGKNGYCFVWPVRGGKTRPYVLTVKKEGTGKGKITATDLSCYRDYLHRSLQFIRGGYRYC